MATRARKEYCIANKGRKEETNKQTNKQTKEERKKEKKERKERKI